MATEWKEVEVASNVVYRVPANLEPIHVAKHIECLDKPNWCAFGKSFSFRCMDTGQKCVVVKVRDVFSDLTQARDFLREVKLLRSFQHENVIATLDLYPSDHPQFDHFYLQQEFMDSSLDRLIRYQGPSFPDHTCRYFAYAIFRGLRYLHGIGVVHRDLKPTNILVSSHAEVKIGDFRYALVLGNELARPEFAESVPAACYYRPPEFALLASAPAKAADIWSTGCIFAELMGGEPVFQGRNRLDQLRKILDVLGKPGPEDMDWLPEGSAPRHVLEAQDVMPGRPWSKLYPTASEEVSDALSQLLHFNPVRRPSASGAMRLPLFAGDYEEDHETAVEAKKLDWVPEDAELSKGSFQDGLLSECRTICPERNNEVFVRQVDDSEEKAASVASETVVSEEPQPDHEYSVWVKKEKVWKPRGELHMSLLALDQFFKDSFGSLAQAFAAVDNNGSGEVVLTEWNERLGNLGFVDRHQVDEQKASKALFKLLAAGGDGDNVSISKNELLLLNKLDRECSDETWQDLLYGDHKSGCPSEILRLREEQARHRKELLAAREEQHRKEFLATHEEQAQHRRSFDKTHPTIVRRRERSQTTPDPLGSSKAPFMTRSRPSTSAASLH